MVRARGIAAGAVVGAVLLSAACGSGSGAKPAPTAGSTSGTSASTAVSTSASAAPGALTDAQLQAALLTEADLPGTQIDPAGEGTGVKQAQGETISSGGAGCQQFFDATEVLATKYGTTAEADRSLDGGTRYQLTVAWLPSAAKAQQAVADAQAGLAGCPGSFTGDFSGVQLTMSLNSLDVTPAGDKSVAYTALSKNGTEKITLYVQFLQVGSAVAEVAVISEKPDDDPVTMAALVGAAARKQVAKLQAAEPKS